MSLDGSSLALFSCRIIINAILSLGLLSPLLIVGLAQAVDSVTVTSIDHEKSLVTVRDNGTGTTNQIKIDDIEALKAFKVGEVLEKPAGLDVQSRAAQSPRTKAGKGGLGDCLQRCMAAGGSTLAQCSYWCATR